MIATDRLSVFPPPFREEPASALDVFAGAFLSNENVEREPKTGSSDSAEGRATPRRACTGDGNLFAEQMRDLAPRASAGLVGPRPKTPCPALLGAGQAIDRVFWI
jgi:hypothetical protein